MFFYIFIIGNSRVHGINHIKEDGNYFKKEFTFIIATSWKNKNVHSEIENGIASKRHEFKRLVKKLKFSH